MRTERRTGGSRDRGSSASRNAEGRATVLEEEVEEEVSWVDWQSALYLLVLGAVCVFLAPRTDLWWIVPVLGVAAPTIVLVLERAIFEGPRDRKAKEHELLEALVERGEDTAATVALRTSLTVDEASKLFDELADKGHLEVRSENGFVAYSLPGQNRPREQRGVPRPDHPSSDTGATSGRLSDPLSERELEVLALLASGKTNAEIAGDLCIAMGTVKSHVNNIYRKLDAANRAEAVARARELNLPR